MQTKKYHSAVSGRTSDCGVRKDQEEVSFLAEIQDIAEKTFNTFLNENPSVSFGPERREQVVELLVKNAQRQIDCGPNILQDCNSNIFLDPAGASGTFFKNFWAASFTGQIKELIKKQQGYL